MILAGKKSRTLKKLRSETVVCSKCNSKNSTEISVIGYYKHLLQIPFLSGGKTGKSTCIKCKHSLEKEFMTDPIKLAFYELNETVKTPIWFYSGLIIIKTLVLIKIFSKYI